MLLRAQSDLSIVNFAGNTPLLTVIKSRYFLRQQNSPLVCMLMEYGADASHENEQKVSALSIAKIGKGKREGKKDRDQNFWRKVYDNLSRIQAVPVNERAPLIDASTVDNDILLIEKKQRKPSASAASKREASNKEGQPLVSKKKSTAPRSNLTVPPGTSTLKVAHRTLKSGKTSQAPQHLPATTVITHINENGKPRSMRPTRDFRPANSTQLVLRGLTVKEQKATAENGTLHVTKVLGPSEQLQEIVLSKEFVAIQKFILEAFGTDEDEIKGYITGSLQFKKDTPFEKLFYQLTLSANFIHRLMNDDDQFILELDRHGNAYVQRILVDLDANLTELSIDIVGNSLAHHIVLYGTDDQLQQLLLYDVNLLHRNCEGQTPLELAKTIIVHLSHQSNIINGEPSKTKLSRLYHIRITMLENIIKILTAQQKITEGIDKLRELDFSACSRFLNESTDLSNVPLHSKFKYLLSGGAQYLLQAHEFWYFLSCPTIMRIVQYVRESPSRERHIVKPPEHVCRALENYTPRDPITVVRLLLQFDHYPPELTAL